MTKDELQAKRTVALRELKDIEVALCLDEHYIDIIEKENAELKEYRLSTLKKNQTEIQKYALNLEHKLSWYDDQLTKAKEIIKDLLEYNKENWLYSDIKKQAEQFIK